MSLSDNWCSRYFKCSGEGCRGMGPGPTFLRGFKNECLIFPNALSPSLTTIRYFRGFSSPGEGLRGMGPGPTFLRGFKSEFLIFPNALSPYLTTTRYSRGFSSPEPDLLDDFLRHQRSVESGVTRGRFNPGSEPGPYLEVGTLR